MKKNQIFYILAFASIVVLVSCSKEVGPAGPAGPAGADGANGADGADGAPGPDSVLYSNWMPMNMSENIDINSDTTYSQDFPANAITSDIINSGTVLTYLSGVDGNGNSFIYNAATALTESYYVGSIFVVSPPPAPSHSAGFNFAGYYYRFIVIPGSIAVTAFKGMTQQQIRTASYPAITKMLNLPAAESNIPKKFISQ